MADLLTHYVSSRLPGEFLGDPAARSTLALGVFLPDLLSKPMEQALPYMAWTASHTPLGAAFVAFAVTMLFAPAFRLKAFVTLFAGQLLHIAVDVGKDSQGFGSSFLLFPFSAAGFELGLYTSQDVFWFLPGNIFVLLALRFLARRLRNAGLVWK